MYPNPAEYYTIIDFDAGYNGAIVIVKDVTGRELFETKLVTSPQQLRTGNLPSGVYLVTLYCYGQVGDRLLVKE